MGVWNQSLVQGACMDFGMILEEWRRFLLGDGVMCFRVDLINVCKKRGINTGGLCWQSRKHVIVEKKGTKIGLTNGAKFQGDSDIMRIVTQIHDFEIDLSM